MCIINIWEKESDGNQKSIALLEAFMGWVSGALEKGHRFGIASAQEFVIGG